MFRTNLGVSLSFALAFSMFSIACQDSTGPGGKSQLSDVTAAQVVDTAGSIFRSVSVTLKQASRVEVFYTPLNGGDVLRMRADSAALSHSLLLPRLLPGTTYRYAIRTYADTLESDSIFRGTFTTGALPAELQNFNYTMQGDATFPVLMVPFRNTTGGFAGQVAFDTRGRGVIWFIRSRGGTLVAAPVPDSHDMVYIEGGFPGDASNGIVRADPSGHVVAQLDRNAAQFGQIHHDLMAADSVRVLFLAFDTRTVRDTAVTAEAIWEWNTRTGAVTKKWTAWDFFNWDTERVPGVPAGSWLFANSITRGSHGNYIVSLRNFNQVFSIAPDFKSLEWRMGGPGSTLKVAPADQFKGQHSASQLQNGNVLVFDNQGGATGIQEARVVEYQISGDSVRVAYVYKPNPVLLSPVRGGAYRLGSGNTLGIFASTPFEAREVTPGNTVRWFMNGDANFTNIFRAAPWYSIGGEEVVNTMP